MGRGFVKAFTVVFSHDRLALNQPLLEPPLLTSPSTLPHCPEIPLTRRGCSSGDQSWPCSAGCMVSSWLHAFWGLCVLMSEMRGLGWTREGLGGSIRGPGHGSVFGAGVGILGSFPSQQSNSALIYVI